MSSVLVTAKTTTVRLDKIMQVSCSLTSDHSGFINRDTYGVCKRSDVFTAMNVEMAVTWTATTFSVSTRVRGIRI